jgi:hypothetical protein
VRPSIGGPAGRRSLALQLAVRVVVSLAVVALGAVLVACGKGGRPTSSVGSVTGASAGAAAPAKPGHPLTHAQTSAFAHAVNLTRADVPGFSISPREHQHETAGERALEKRLTRCAGGLGSLGGSSGEQSSPNFTRRGSAISQSVSSSVNFAPTDALAKRELGLLRSAHTRVCLSAYLDVLFKGKRFGGAAIRRVSITQGTPPAAGTAGGFGWRITAAIAVRGVAVPFYLDILGFVDGRAQVTLLSTGLLVPFPAAAQEELFGRLLSRARAHPL